MRFKNTPGKGWAPVKLTRAQLQNDLDATRRRFDLLEETCDKLRKDHALQSSVLIAATRDRDDWRDAFKLIMKLVK